MMLQDAAEEGRVAGANATRETPFPFARKLPMAIVFSDPNIAQVGARLDEIPDAVVGHQRFGPVGRALIMGRNRGLIRLYALRGSGRLLGASMVGPRVDGPPGGLVGAAKPYSAGDATNAFLPPSD